MNTKFVNFELLTGKYAFVILNRMYFEFGNVENTEDTLSKFQ
jgi:hypothetical protein